MSDESRHLVVVSHKACWTDPTSASGFATDGGFPFQMRAVAQLFDRTTLLIPHRAGAAPAGLSPLESPKAEGTDSAHQLDVQPVPEPAGTDLRRKLALLLWLPRHLPTLWRTLRRADVVHAAVPGDLGTLGLLLALAQGKPLFVRHCGTWGNRTTLADRFLAWLLPRIARPRPGRRQRVVLATGGGEQPPEPGNPGVEWIFSTSLRQAQLEALTPATPWRPATDTSTPDAATTTPLRLIFTGRLSSGKNVDACIDALAQIRQSLPATLDIFGDGHHRPVLEQRVRTWSEKDASFGSAVTLHGNRPHPEVLEHLCRSHLFLFPTKVAEGFPKSVLEALACGLPVLAPAVSVLPHLLEHRDADPAGVILPDSSAESVAAAVLELVSNPERLVAMAATARRRAESYTLERWRDRIATSLRRAWGPDLAPSESS